MLLGFFSGDRGRSWGDMIAYADGAAIGKGFAIGSAAITALALFSAYASAVGLGETGVNLLNPMVVIGLGQIGALTVAFSDGSTGHYNAWREPDGTHVLRVEPLVSGIWNARYGTRPGDRPHHDRYSAMRTSTTWLSDSSIRLGGYASMSPRRAHR